MVKQVVQELYLKACTEFYSTTKAIPYDNNQLAFPQWATKPDIDDVPVIKPFSFPLKRPTVKIKLPAVKLKKDGTPKNKPGPKTVQEVIKTSTVKIGTIPIEKFLSKRKMRLAKKAVKNLVKKSNSNYVLSKPKKALQRAFL